MLVVPNRLAAEVVINMETGKAGKWDYYCQTLKNFLKKKKLIRIPNIMQNI